MSFYQQTRTAKAATIATIMPWTGPLGAVPDGWIICDGQVLLAKDFPLLTQAIGDTYNSGISDLSGNFPSYTGSITIPNLSNRVLMDIEENYFGTVSSGGTGKSIDTDADARTLLSPLIGDNTDNGVSYLFNDVFTDVVFRLNDRSGYTGKIAGNQIEPGEGTRTIYLGPRKLGRQHVKRHNHPGTYETMALDSKQFPGEGVIPYAPVTYTLYLQGTDNIGANILGDLYYFGWANDQGYRSDFGTPETGQTGVGPGDATYNVDGYPIHTANIRPGLIMGPEGAWNTTTKQYNADWAQTTWPRVNDTNWYRNGYGAGTPGKVLAKVITEQPPVNIIPQAAHKIPITGSGSMLTTPTKIYGKFLDNREQLPFGLGGATVPIPNGYKNSYDGVNASYVRDTFMSHPGYNFTANEPTDTIGAHTHDEFDVVYNASGLKPKSSIIATANIPVTTVPDNTANKNVLQIDFNTTQPSLNCVYIIRAY